MLIVAVPFQPGTIYQIGVWGLQIDINHIEPVLSKHFPMLFSSFFTYFPLTQWHHPGISKNDHWNLRISQAAKAAGEAWQLQHFKQTQHTQDPWRELGFLCAAGFKLAHPRGFEVYITAAACYICCWFNVTSYQGWICGRSEKSLIPAPEVQDPAHRTEDCQKFWISPEAWHPVPPKFKLMSDIEPKNKHKWPFPKRISCHLPDPLGGEDFPANSPLSACDSPEPLSELKTYAFQGW